MTTWLDRAETTVIGAAENPSGRAKGNSTVGTVGQISELIPSILIVDRVANKKGPLAWNAKDSEGTDVAYISL